MAFDNFASPTLPMPPKEYSFDYFNQLVRSLGTYFRVHDSRSPMNMGALTVDLFRVPIYDLNIIQPINNNLSAPLASFLRLTSSIGAFTITGVGNSSDGRLLTIYNASTVNMTIANQNTSSAEASRIITCTGADIVLTGQSVVSLIYSVKDSRWIVTSTQG
jgi:hypothetical protein